MDWVILIVGVAGLLVAGYGLATLTTRAIRSRHYLDIVLAVAVVVVVVAVLVALGDRLVR
ncbi:MAG: hypothetical protein GX624_06530 [Actinobacteria bacterium]|nr:hypothetical protein [Actinomycetota bacterium]